MAYNPNKAAILQRAKSARVRRRQGSLQCARIVLSTNLVCEYELIDVNISSFLYHQVSLKAGHFFFFIVIWIECKSFSEKEIWGGNQLFYFFFF